MKTLRILRASAMAFARVYAAAPARAAMARLIGAAVLAVAITFGNVSRPAAQDSSLSADVRDVIKKLAAQPGSSAEASLSARDRAVLYANNKEINAAGKNGEIPNDVYQTAQRDFDALNRKFASEAA